jgi:hypothetical protein
MTFDELELVAALLYNVKLGHGISPYRDAAFNLMQKIDTFAQDDDFGANASANVDMHVNILDDTGYVEASYPSDRVEIEV